MSKNMGKNKRNFSVLEVILLVMISLLIGLGIGTLLNNGSSIAYSGDVIDAHVVEFIKHYNYITSNYYEEIDKNKLINGAISGMTESLEDPYSVYYDETQTNNFSITLDGSYKGVGIQITKEEDTGYILVNYVFKNSPAAKAGIKIDDRIISIDGQKVTDLTTSDFSNLVRNSEKDSFDITILRNNKKTNITLKKEVVTLESISTETYEVGNKKVGYIYIGVFASNTNAQFTNALSELEKQNIDSLIIDVRGNTGGHLTAVDGILDLFLNSSQIMYQFEKNGTKTAVYGKGNESIKYEIVLLGDSVSASASEVLIAGLRENLNAKFFGKKTFGKGTVQEMVKLSDGTQYKITVKKWLTPKGNWINETEGILPDVEVELEDDYYKTYEDEDDTQLQKALKYLKEQK